MACRQKNNLASKPASRYALCMMIFLANTKGGVGKSTIAVHLAVWLHDQGFKTALLDADKQRSSSEWVAEAESGITVRVCDTPDSCLEQARELAETHDFLVGDGPGGLDEEKRTLEGILGTSLEPGQQVFILAYTPGVAPTDEARDSARTAIEQLLSENQAFAAQQGIISAETDDVVAEAMRQTRRRA